MPHQTRDTELDPTTIDWNNPDVDRLFKYFSAKIERGKKEKMELRNENKELRNENKELRNENKELRNENKEIGQEITQFGELVEKFQEDTKMLEKSGERKDK